MSTAELTGSGLLGSLVLFGIAAINVNRHGIDGCMERIAERQVRRAVWLRTTAKTLRTFWTEWPRVWRGNHQDELGKVLGREGNRV